ITVRTWTTGTPRSRQPRKSAPTVSTSRVRAGDSPGRARKSSCRSRRRSAGAVTPRTSCRVAKVPVRELRDPPSELARPGEATARLHDVGGAPAVGQREDDSPLDALSELHQPDRLV